MIYSIFPKHDVTLYEQHPDINTSNDEILDLTKIVSSSKIAGKFNSRILLDFQLNSLNTVLVGAGKTDLKYILNLYVAHAETPSPKYNMEISNVSESWSPGYGRLNQNPKSKDGVSWKYKSTGETWTGDAGLTLTTSSIVETITNSEDIRTDISSIVTSGPDYGFTVKRSTANESDGNKNGTIKYFSSKTSTVYKPRVEVCYSDATFTTGSLSALTTTKDIFIQQLQNKGEYRLDSTVKFGIAGREKYPAKTYGTSSIASTVKYLPETTYYSLVDLKTGETVIPFDTTYTKVSCDANGNYLNLKLSGLYIDRFYQFRFRVDANNTTEYYDVESKFKVVS